MQSWFTWSVVGVVAPAILGVAGLIMGIELESQYGPVLVVLAALWVFLTIWMDKTGRAKVWSSVATITLAALLVIWIEGMITSKQLSANEGPLIPGGFPYPLSKCPIPKGAFAVYCGDAVAITTGSKQIVFGNNDYELLSVFHDKNEITVNARIFDERRDLVAKIENNNFIVTSRAAYKKRPDRSTLIVFDHQDNEVLNLRFVNENAVVISHALLYSPDGKIKIETTPTTVQISNAPIFSGICVKDAKCMFFLPKLTSL
jgi:hypothetical protein